MRFEFKLPDLAEGMVEGEVVSWLVAPGDAIKQEQPVVEVMTDKATVVISSPHAGKFLEPCHEAGDIAPVGQPLFVLDIEGEAGDPPPAEAAAPAAEDSNGESKAGKGKKGRKKAAPKPAPTAAAEAPVVEAAPPVQSIPQVSRGPSRALATPATRRLARELGVDIGRVHGSGPAGRVTKADVQAFSQGGAPAPTFAPASAAQAAVPEVAPSAPIFPIPRPVAGEEREERIKVRGLRRAIYETMARSSRTAAHFTYVEEVDCTNLVSARQRLKATAEASGVRMTYLPFISKAVMLALRAFPKMNASMDDEAGEVVIKHYHHLGIAAATEAGLVVPVIKHANQLSLLELAASIADLGARARSGGLRPDELKGSTFTITSLGREGGLFATPLINHPEVAIMGVHKMEARAVIREGAVVPRQMMNISLSFDHRVIDGHEGAAFAQRVKHYLEDPELMMLEMS